MAKTVADLIIERLASWGVKTIFGLPGDGINGLFEALRTHQDLIGTHHQQDVDLDKLFIDVAAYNQRIMGPSHVANAVDEAIKTALARRTVAHLTIPKDIQDWTQDETTRSDQNIPQHSGIVYMPAWPLPPQPLLEVAANLINAGTKVAILVGQGCLNARDEVLELAGKVGGPIIKA